MQQFGQLMAISGIVITSIVLILVALLMAVIGWFQARGARAAKQWSVTQGEVMEASVEQYRHTDSDGTMTAYRPRIIYGYRVGGRDYVGERLNFGTGLHSSIRSFAENKARQFPTGSKVQVYYDPKNPNEASLERSSPSSRLMYVIALALFLIAIVVLVGGIAFSSAFV